MTKKQLKEENKVLITRIKELSTALRQYTATPPSRQSRDTSPCTGEALRIATPPMAARNDRAQGNGLPRPAASQ